MEQLKVIAIDLAKSIFQVHGADGNGRTLFSRRVARRKLLDVLARLPRVPVAMEACSSAHHWGRTLMAMGFEVRLLPAREVKPFAAKQKTDASDAAAIAEAARRPNLRPVPVKTTERQAVCSAHAVRTQLVGMRTAKINILRGHLAEFGITEQLGAEGVRALAARVRSADPGIPPMLVIALSAVIDGIAADEQAIEDIERALAAAAQADDDARRLTAVPGIGKLTASALVSFIGDARRFRNSRAFVSWLGLAPRVQSSGGKTRLGGITKQGQVYLRTLLIHCARTVVYWRSKGRAGGRSAWLDGLVRRARMPVVITAMAAKLGRIVWAMLARGDSYRADAGAAPA